MLLLFSFIFFCLSTAATTTLVQVITTVPQSFNVTSRTWYDWYQVPSVWYDATMPRMVGQVFFGPVTSESWSVTAVQANFICTRGCSVSASGGNYISVGLVIYQTASSAPPYNCGGPVVGCALNKTLLMTAGVPTAAVFTFPTGACTLNVNEALYYAGFTAFAPANNDVGLVIQQNTNGRAYAGYANSTYVPGGACSGGNGVGPGNQMNVQSFYLTGTASTLGPASPLVPSAAPTPAPTTNPTANVVMMTTPAPSTSSPTQTTNLVLILVSALFYLILV